MKDTLISLARRYRVYLWIVGALLLIGFPVTLGTPYLIQIMILVFIYIVLASSLNLITGFTGMFSLGHGAFYGIGAYTSAILALGLSLPFWVTMPLAGIFAAVIGAFIGLATLRLRQTFLVFGTLAFGEIVRIVIMNWPDLTRGPFGIPGIPAPAIFGFSFKSYSSYYYLVLVFMAISVFAIYRLYHSRVGRAWVAIREDETAAATMGVPVFGYKVLAFTIGCLFAGLAGAFYAHFVTYISADQFSVNESFLILTMVAIGGTGSIVGPIIGALILIVVPEVFRFLAQYRTVFYGLLLIVVMVVKPEGIAGVKAIFMRAPGSIGFSLRRKKSAGGNRAPEGTA